MVQEHFYSHSSVLNAISGGGFPLGRRLGILMFGPSLCSILHPHNCLNLTPVLVEVAESINIDGNEAKKIIRNRTYKEATELDCKRSRTLNITVAPTFLLNNQILVGAQKYETLENFLISNHVEKRNLFRPIRGYDEVLLMAG